MNILEIQLVNKSIILQAKEIIRVEAVNSYSRIYFIGGKSLVVAKVLSWFEQRLPLEMFIRVHRSHLVNKFFVHEIDSVSLKSLQLQNGEVISVSRRKKRALKFTFST